MVNAELGMTWRKKNTLLNVISYRIITWVNHVMSKGWSPCERSTLWVYFFLWTCYHDIEDFSFKAFYFNVILCETMISMPGPGLFKTCKPSEQKLIFVTYFLHHAFSSPDHITTNKIVQFKQRFVSWTKLKILKTAPMLKQVWM